MTGTASYLVTSSTENYFSIGAENYFSRRYRELIFLAYNTLQACDGGGLARVFPARFSSSLSAGSASSALPSGNRSSGSSSGSSGSLVSELHRRFPLLLRGAEAALIPNKGLTVHQMQGMSLPSKTLLLWVYSVKHQQLARKRSVTSVEIVL